MQVSSIDINNEESLECTMRKFRKEFLKVNYAKLVMKARGNFANIALFRIIKDDGCMLKENVVI